MQLASRETCVRDFASEIWREKENACFNPASWRLRAETGTQESPGREMVLARQAARPTWQDQFWQCSQGRAGEGFVIKLWAGWIRGSRLVT
eukprot:6175050-Pleurochrysis_carterae.AAC.1